MDHGQTDWECLEADKRILKEYVPRRKNMGEYDRRLCIFIQEGIVCSCSNVARPRRRRRGSGVRALQSYDTVRKQVMDVDERGREHLSRIARAIT